MSRNYRANQYDIAFKPNSLCNWEVPKHYCPIPKTRTGKTRFIANDEGNLLPGVPRSKSSPFGEYIGTWHLPRKITREIANQLNGLADLERNKLACKIKVENTHKENIDQVEVQKSARNFMEPRQEKKLSRPMNKANPCLDMDINDKRFNCPVHGCIDISV